MRNKVLLEKSTNLWRALVVVGGGTTALSSLTTSTTDYSTRTNSCKATHHQKKPEPEKIHGQHYLREVEDQTNSDIPAGEQSRLRISNEARNPRKQLERPTRESTLTSSYCNLNTPVYPLATFADEPRGTTGPLATFADATRGTLRDDDLTKTSSVSVVAQQQHKIVEYDFVIIGNGNAGHAAVETLQQQCPGASIALVDPLRPPPPASTSSSRQHPLDYYATFAAGLDPHNRIVKLLENRHYSGSSHDTFERQRGGPVKSSQSSFNNSSSSSSSSTTTTTARNVRLRYRHAILLATGNHGAPPPNYLIDPNAQSRVMELRPTFRPSVPGGVSSSSSQSHQRPFVPAMRVREIAVEAASRGETVGVLGSGWDAIDVAVEAATAAATHRSTTTTSSASPHPQPWMIYGSGGPVSHILPNYLSAAVAKRLRSRKASSSTLGRVRILDRTLIRYINLEEETHGNSNDNNTKLRKKAHVQMYTAKSNDFLDTQRINVDLLVITGDGNAVLPTEDIPKSLRESSGDGRSWYKSWSQLTFDNDINNDTDSSSNTSSEKLLLCYKDDGRVVVNPEFSACTGVFAAGSVAKCGNSLTGHTNVAGVGAVDGPASGRVAATNMSHYYNNKGRGLLFGQTTTSASRIASKDPVPVWRSDLLSYDANSRTMSALASVGIHALCVGHCDSERFSTHGVWWTNLAAQKRLLARQQQDEHYVEEKNGADQGNDRSLNRRRLGQKSLHPVFGLGIVFYLDRTGKIQGVMTWGLPFSNNDLQLNNDLVQRMKQIIVRSNMSSGFVNNPSAPFALGSESQMRMSDLFTLESRRLLATAFSSLVADVQDVPKPLHRFTEVRPPRVRSVGVLKRNDDGHGQGVMGEDMFYGTATLEQEDRSPVPMKPVAGVGFASPQAGTVESPSTDNDNDSKASSNSKSAYTQRRNTVRTRNVSYQSVQNMHNFYLYEHREKQFADNEALARPPKEEPLWIRKGDEKRQTNAAESRSAALRAAFGA